MTDHAPEANARLIAAAPDLLVCLERMARAFSNPDQPPEPIVGFALIEQARAAIAKAQEGTTEAAPSLSG